MWEYNYSNPYYSDELYHHGVKGQKWGVRRYQNYDGTAIKSARSAKRAASKEAFKANLYATSKQYTSPMGVFGGKRSRTGYANALKAQSKANAKNKIAKNEYTLKKREIQGKNLSGHDVRTAAYRSNLANVSATGGRILQKVAASGTKSNSKYVSGVSKAISDIGKTQVESSKAIMKSSVKTLNVAKKQRGEAFVQKQLKTTGLVSAAVGATYGPAGALLGGLNNVATRQAYYRSNR